MLLLPFLFLLQGILAIPVPRLITRVHTAPAVTSTATYITGTTTVWLPPIEVFISNGVTYTYTLTEGQWATTQIINTSTYVAPTTDAGQPEATPTEKAAVPAASSPSTVTTETTAATETAAETAVATSTAATSTATTSTATTSTAAETTQAATSTAAETTQAATSTAAETTQAATSSAAETTQAATSTAAETTQAATSTAAETTQATTQAASTATTAQAAETSSTQTTQTTQTQSFIFQAVGTDTQATASSTATSSPSTQSSQSTSGLSAPGTIVYSPYANDRSCKTYDTIQSDLQLIQSKGISKIRLYSTDCLSLTAVLPLCQQMGITVNQGFWISGAGVDSIDSSVSDLIDWANTNGWSVFDFITIGNEAVNSGFCSVSDLISKISSVKSTLKSAGYSGQVTTAEPPATFIASPELCTDSEIDFVAVQPHSYFNTNLYASDAGEYVVQQRDQVAKVCSKSAYISETGYPHKGNTNGNNVPSDANQLAALQSIMKSTGGDVTILTTYDDMWKDPGSYNIEQYFGMINLL